MKSFHSLPRLAKKRSRPSSDRSFLCRDAARTRDNLALELATLTNNNDVTTPQEADEPPTGTSSEIFSPRVDEDEWPTELPYRATDSIASTHKMRTMPSLLSLSSFIRSDSLDLPTREQTFSSPPSLSGSATSTPCTSAQPSPITLEFGADVQVFPLVNALSKSKGKKKDALPHGAMAEQARVGFDVFSPRVNNDEHAWGEAI